MAAFYVPIMTHVADPVLVLANLELTSFPYFILNVFSDIIAVTSEETDEHVKKAKVKNGIDFYCSVCKETLNLTSIDILKHKRSHL